MTQQIKKINKKAWAAVSFLIVSMIVGFVRLGFPFGLEKEKNSAKLQEGDFTNIAHADSGTSDEGGFQVEGCGNSGGCGCSGGSEGDGEGC